MTTFHWGEWLQASPNSQWVAAWRYPYSYFCVVSHLCLSSGGPLIPDVLLADGADWHRKSPLLSLWGWQWHSRTFRWALGHFVTTYCRLLWWGYHSWVLWWGLPRPPSTGAPASRQDPKNASECFNTGLMKQGIFTILGLTFSCWKQDSGSHFTRRYMKKRWGWGEGMDTQAGPAEFPNLQLGKNSTFYSENYQSLEQPPQGQDDVPINRGF